MNACFFGIYDPKYERNRVIMRGLKESGYNIIECRVDPKIHKGLSKYFELYKEFKKLPTKRFKYVFVAFPGHTIVWLARILFGSGIIFDAHISLYDSNVFDRKVYSKYSLGALKDWLLDWYSCSIANKVLLDTYEHISYFVETFHLPRGKFIRVLVGADNDVFKHIENNNGDGTFVVHFHGTFIPLQGIQYIIDAANILRNENINFRIIGSGGELFKQIKDKVSSLNLNNVTFVGRVPFDEMPSHISMGNVCLGIFGDTAKANRVIPNKAYECVAMGVPVINARTLGIKEVFTEGKDMLFCNIADGKDLAEKILLMKNNPEYAREIGENGYNTFTKYVTPGIIGKQLLSDLSK